MFRPAALGATVALCAVLTTACHRGVPADVAATVNDKPITYAELDREFNSQFNAGGQRPVDDQLVMQKLEVLRSMIDSEVMLQRAEKLNLLAPDSDVDAELNKLKAPYTPEEFQKQLSARGLTVADLRAKIRRDLSVAKLFNKEITSQISITQKEITDAYNANRGDFNLPEPRIHLAQIVVTPVADPNVRNLKNDKAQSDDQARQKITLLANRLRQGEDFTMLAQNYSEDPNTAGNGGDLGFVGESALEKASPDLRKMIDSLQPGQFSAPTHSQDAYRIFKVISKEPAGQRELNDPRVQETIREGLLNRKDQLLKSAYYEMARNEAKIKNYYAENIWQNKGKPTH